jgi:hypothetical protein
MDSITVKEHPVEQLEPEVSAMFQRAMRKADLENRYMEPNEELVHVAMSIAVSLKRISDDYSKFVWFLISTAIVGPFLAVMYLGVMVLALMKLH